MGEMLLRGDVSLASLSFRGLELAKSSALPGSSVFWEDGLRGAGEFAGNDAAEIGGKITCRFH